METPYTERTKELIAESRPVGMVLRRDDSLANVFHRSAACSSLIGATGLVETPAYEHPDQGLFFVRRYSGGVRKGRWCAICGISPEEWYQLLELENA